MCGRRRQHPQPHPATRLFAALNGATAPAPPPPASHLHAVPFDYTARACCHRQPRYQQHQTLTGLAVNAIAGAVERKNAERERNARAGAVGGEGSLPVVGRQERGVVGRRAGEGSGEDGYEGGRLDELVRGLTLVDGRDDGEKGAEKADIPATAVEDAPPAYTPTPEVADVSRVARGGASARAAGEDSRRAGMGVGMSRSANADSFPFPSAATPLLARHAAHPTIVTDLHGLETALAAYRSATCGSACAVKRARKQLVRDLGMLEAERVRMQAGSWGNRREARMEMRSVGREVKREGRVVREVVRGVMRGQ